MIATLILNLYFWPLFTIITLTVMAFSPPLLLLNRFLFRIPLDRFVRTGVRIYGRIIIAALFPLVRVKVDDRRGKISFPVIYAANHLSAIDPYLFGVLSGDNGFVTTWPFKIPLYSRFMKICAYINADRGFDHVQQEALRLLDAGCSLIIWPEGHRSRNGVTGRFKNGAFLIAGKAQVAVVPVCIIGSGKVMPPEARLLRPGTIEIILLEPVFPRGRADEPESVYRLKNQVRGKIIRALRETEPALHRTNTATEEK